MFERFTERARQVVVLAQEEARARDDNYIGVEHILLGLMREEAGLAAQILSGLGVTRDKIYESVDQRKVHMEHVPPRPEVKTLPFTPRAQKVLELALREALSLGHNYIGTEHILLGLVRENDNVGTEILADDFNLDAEKIRNEVIRVLSGPKAPIRVKGADSKPEGSKTLENGMALYSPSDLTNIVSIAIDLARRYPDKSAKSIIEAAKQLG